jgi:RNA polymerase sigma-70 factor (ECF subfamily)
VRLARLLARLLPDEPGPDALLALVLLQDSRRAARVDADGQVVLLADQDRARWDHDLVQEGLTWLRRAQRHGAVSAGVESYRLQAELAAAHARAARWDDTDWDHIVATYDRLLGLTGSPVVAVNRAVAVSYAEGPGPAERLLATLADDPRLGDTAALALARADVLSRLGREAEAVPLLEAALVTVRTDPEREQVRRRLTALR